MDDRHKDSNNSRSNLALAGFILIAAFFLVTEHKAHLLGFFAEQRTTGKRKD